MEILWGSRDAERIISRQKVDGRWEYPGGGNGIRKQEDYDQMESFRQLGLLVEKFGFTRRHPCVERACQFLFSHQTQEGDFRGIYGQQYSPNYSAAIMELMIKAGYEDDTRVKRGFSWLLSIRQDDGGWAIPIRTAPKTSAVGWTETLRLATITPDRSKPSSHFVTGVVLRAFAAHKAYGRSKAAQTAAEFLCRRLFTRDAYTDRQDQEFWWRVSFPFWFTDIVSALDSLSLLGFTSKDVRIHNALRLLGERQIPDGSFRLKLLRTGDADTGRWVAFAICRVFVRLFPEH